MRRTHALAAVVVMACALVLWFFVGHRRTERASPRPPTPVDTATQDALIQEALGRIVSAPDPFRAAREESDRLRAMPTRTAVVARRAWDRGAHWPVCATIAVLGEDGAAAVPWLSKAVEGDVAARSAVAALARWFIDARAHRAIEALVAMQARFGDDAQSDVQEVLRRLRAAGAPTVQCLMEELDKPNRWWAVGVIRMLGDEAAEAVPVFEALIAELSRGPEPGPLFGTDERYDFMEVLLSALPHLGDTGVEASVRLLYCADCEVSDIAFRTIRAAPRRFSVTQVLSAAPKDPEVVIPTVVSELLARLQSSAAEWKTALRFVTRDSNDGKLAFLDAIFKMEVDGGRLSILLETLLAWQIDDPVVESRRLDVLTRVAPGDPRIARIVEDMLARGSADQRAAMLWRMAPHLSAFSREARSAALAMSSSREPYLRASAVEMLARSEDAVADERALAMIKAALEDDVEEVLVAALKAMASRGRAARPLVPLALVEAAESQPRTQLELLRAIANAGSNPIRVVAQVRRAWVRAAESRHRGELREGVVDFLQEYQEAGVPFPSIAAVAAELLETDGLAGSTKEKLRALSEGRR